MEILIPIAFVFAIVMEICELCYRVYLKWIGEDEHTPTKK